MPEYEVGGVPKVAESIYYGDKGIFVALEATEGTYLAPTATGFIVTEDLSVTPSVWVGDTVNIDSLDNGVIAKDFLSTRYTQYDFKVPLSWPSVAPAAGAGSFAISPLLEACGFVAPAYSAGPPVTLTYAEQTALELLKTVSISLRTRRSATTQLEKRSAGCRGHVGFTWEIGKVPRFTFSLLGSYQAIVSGSSLAQTPGSQITNMADAGQSAQVTAATLGGKALCLTKLDIKKLARIKANWQAFSCGERAQPESDNAIDIVVTAKFPNIDTEFNPDAFIGGEYPLVLTLAQIGGSRTASLSYSTVQVKDWKPVMLGSELGCEMTLRPTSKISIVTQ